MSSLNHVPNDLFLNREIFKSVLKDCWESLSDGKKDEITNRCLPSSLTSGEKSSTVHQLLNSDLKTFGVDPLETAFFQLKITKLAPDISRVLDDVRKLNAKACKLKEKENQMLLWTEVLTRRKRLFKESLSCAPFDSIQALDKKQLIKDSHYNVSGDKRCDLIPDYIGQIVSKRYHRELKDLHVLVGKKNTVISSDEEDHSSHATDNVDFLFGENVETNCNAPLFLKQQKFDPVKSSSSSSSFTSNKLNESRHDSYSEYRYRILMKQHKRKKKMSNKLPPSTVVHSNGILEEIIARAKGIGDDSILLVSPPSMRHCQPVKKLKKFKSSLDDLLIQPEKEVTSTGLEVMSRKLNLNLESVKKESVFDFTEDSPSETLPVKLSVSNTNNNISITNNNSNSNNNNSSSSNNTSNSSNNNNNNNNNNTNSIPSMVPSISTVNTSVLNPPIVSKSKPVQAPVVYEKPPSSFFSLIRDIFRSHAPNDQKLTLHKLEELTKEKLRNINPALGWNHESVQSAMNFLSYYAEPDASGENVPLVDYKEKNQQWQWIGVDRDSDDVLIRMCKEWTAEKDRNSAVIDPSQPIPPSICPTQWTVQPSTDEERRAYREQEAIRYRNPQRAFTYRVHSYESVVGPVKGCGNATASTPAASPNKAREHSLLVSDRPPFVTLLSLVRDAAARLPNGEGTRADICELLKDSQYLLPSVSDQQINSIVSGALDRLHYEKDPCVKYDVNRKVWIYLHRNRTEGDFERLHEMQVAAAKAKRNLSKSQRSKPTVTRVPSVTTTVVTGVSNSLASPPASAVKQVPLQHSNQLKVSTNAIATPTTLNKCNDVSTLVQSCNSNQKLTVTPLAPKVSPQIHTTTVTSDTTDQNILNILNQAQGNAKLITTSTCKPNALTKKDLTESSTPSVSISTIGTSNTTITPVSVPTSVVSMIPVVSLPQVAKVFNTTEVNTSNGIVSRLLQGTQAKSILKTVAAGKVDGVPNDLQKKFSLSQTTANVTAINKTKVQSPVQPIVRHLQHNQAQTISIQSPGQQLTVPSSLLIGARSGQVVLGMFFPCFIRAKLMLIYTFPFDVSATGAGGKSYMMTAAPTPGSIVIQNSSGGTTNMTPATLAQATSGLRVQNIKVISMPSNSPRLIVPQHAGQVVARIITRPSTPGSNIQPSPIVMTPNTGFQPVILTPAALPSVSTTGALQATSTTLTQQSTIAPSTVQSQQQHANSQLTTVPIVISSKQANVQ